MYSIYVKKKNMHFNFGVNCSFKICVLIKDRSKSVFFFFFFNNGQSEFVSSFLHHNRLIAEKKIIISN